MCILGIETSCDETAAAVLEDRRVLSNIVLTQTLHASFGGVVPELASRCHLEWIDKVVQRALKEAEKDIDDIDAIAVTIGPGLAGSLIVGVSFAKALSFSANKRLFGINHLQAHIAAASLSEDVEFPALSLIASGGHTELVYVKEWGNYKSVGRTLDDAAGELLDKIGRFLGLPFPAGAKIEEYAERGEALIEFPPPYPQSLNFSFSGLKTAIIKFLKHKKNNYSIETLCASLQEVLFSILVQKTIRAAKMYDVHSLILSGGVGANKRLRALFEEAAKNHGYKPILCKKEFCTDNAAMVAACASFSKEEKDLSLDINPSLGVEDG